MRQVYLTIMVIVTLLDGSGSLALLAVAVC